MKRSLRACLLAVGCVSFAASAHSQSLAEAARKEKARRAEIAKTGQDKPAVLDEWALRNAEAETFTEVKATGAAERQRPSDIGRPAPSNPNKARAATPPKTTPTTPPSSTTPRVAKTELGRGWSTGKDNTTQMRDAPPGTKPIHETTPRRCGGQDLNGNPICH